MRKINAKKLFVIWLIFSFVMTGVITVLGTLYAYNHGLTEIDLPNEPKLIVNIIMLLHSPFLLFISHRAKAEHCMKLTYISLGLFALFFFSSLSSCVSLMKAIWGI